MFIICSLGCEPKRKADFSRSLRYAAMNFLEVVMYTAIIFAFTLLSFTVMRRVHPQNRRPTSQSLRSEHGPVW